MRLGAQKKNIFVRERRYKISLQALSLSRFGDAWNIIKSRCGFNLHRTTQVADEEESRFIKLTMDNVTIDNLWLFEICLVSRPRARSRFL